MGIKPLPSAMQDAKCYYERHPERENKKEPKESRPLGAPPKTFTPEQKKLWRDIARELPYGVGKVSDRRAFALLVRLQDREDRDRLEISERNQLIKLYAEFGMTPSSRTKIQVEPVPENKLAKFTAKRKPAPIPQVSPVPGDCSVQ